ncbi:MAG: gliding motility-associated C-terminal domain-containing protein [Flavobacteriales bacterium]
MRSLLLIASLLGAFGLTAQGPLARFTENKGQWPERVLYRAMVPGGAMFVERNALTYVLVSGGEHEHHGQVHADEKFEPRKAHAYRVTFEGSQGGTPEGHLKQAHYENYFIGNDPEHWGSGCGVYGEVWVKGIYPGIDLRIDGRHGVKYDLIVASDVDPAIVKMRYDGQAGIELKNEELLITTSAGTVVEEKPVAFKKVKLIHPGECGLNKTPVEIDFGLDCAYRLRGNVMSFRVEPNPSGLIIDPSITFGSYSGSTADNFGFTATYDSDGHLYGGGIVFGVGYPTTLGVLDASFNGNTIDVGISKWLPDGTNLVWSTYLGGALGNESPHSLVVNNNDELFVFGSTGSSDFAVTPGCYDNSFGGGPALVFGVGYGYGHNSGTDAFVAHFSADATTLIGSTFMGGSGNDALNNNAPLAHNYGDAFRGEIALDANGDPVVATSTESNNATVSAGAPQAAFGGGLQDAYIFRLNAALTNLLWATYHGGSGTDSGYGVQFDSNGQVFVTGGTTSANLPLGGTPFNGAFSGTTDGYIVRYNAAGTSRLSATYLGTAAYDQSYFVQLNLADEVFVVGQTYGAYPVTAGKYANAGSSQFIHKFSHDLDASVWSTVIGNGSSTQDLSPSAFLVSDCGQIYFSGWGGSVNTNAGLFNSSTSGLPTTPGAFQTTTDASDFYLMVLEPEAVALNYATFFGGAISHEHVDGGTSRFDKNGNVYQAVCAGCGSNNDFPTTPGAWSNTNNSFNCNLGVFKFNLNQPIAVISINGPNTICLGTPVQFNNSSTGGSTYNWWFGDNNTSTDFEPLYTYGDTGVYTVMMVLSDSTACTPDDTAYLQLEVIPLPTAAVAPIGPLCAGDSVQLQASGGDTYSWDPATDLSNALIADPWAAPSNTTTYTVTATTVCGSDTASITVLFSVPAGGAGPDTLICLGESTPITASGGGTYSWSPSATLNDPTLQNPTATPLDTTEYIVTITTPGGCVIEDTLTVFVQFGLPTPVLNDTATCPGNAVQLQASGADSYAWQAAPGIATLDVADPFVTPPAPMYYVCQFSNACGSVLDSAFVDVVIVSAHAWPDTVICPGESVMLFASGGSTYAWSPAGSLDDTSLQTPTATPSSPTTYQVVVFGPAGCSDTAYAFVDLFPMPVVYAGQDVQIDFGNATQLHGQGDGQVIWSPDTWVQGCTDCLEPWVQPETSTLYTIELTDTNGCKAVDQVLVVVDGSLYVPNTFTPNGDGVNDAFFALGEEVKDFELLVFNRWGEQIWKGEDLRSSWNGTYSGVQSPIDTYVWKIHYSEVSGEKHKLIGHVNLVR